MNTGEILRLIPVSGEASGEIGEGVGVDFDCAEEVAVRVAAETANNVPGKLMNTSDTTKITALFRIVDI
jgi:hypothetical protein